MNNNINKKVEDIMSSVDKNKFNPSKFSQLFNSPEGKKLQKSMGSIDKGKLVDKFAQMNSDEIKQKLKKADLSKLSNLKAEDIINKLKNL